VLGTRGKARPHLGVIVGLDTLHAIPGALPALSTSTDQPLPLGLVRRWLPDSHLTRFVLDRGRRLVEASHTQRTLTAHERPLLHLQWQGRCAVAGCPKGPGDVLEPTTSDPGRRPAPPACSTPCHCAPTTTTTSTTATYSPCATNGASTSTAGSDPTPPRTWSSGRTRRSYGLAVPTEPAPGSRHAPAATGSRCHRRPRWLCSTAARAPATAGPRPRRAAPRPAARGRRWRPQRAGGGCVRRR